MRFGVLLQHPPTGRAGTGKTASVTERAVGNHRDVMLFAPRKHGVLYRPLAQMVEDLVAGRMAPPGDLPNVIEIGRVEVAHAPRQDLAFALEPLEGGDRVFQKDRSPASAGDNNPGGLS